MAPMHHQTKVLFGSLDWPVRVMFGSCQLDAVTFSVLPDIRSSTDCFSTFTVYESLDEISDISLYLALS